MKDIVLVNMLEGYMSILGTTCALVGRTLKAAGEVVGCVVASDVWGIALGCWVT